MKVLVIGSNGPLGKEILKEALEAGLEITALVRHPENFKDAPQGIKIVQGDMMDIKSLEAILPGHDAVISAFGTKLIRTPTTLLSDGTRNLVIAMLKSNVRRLICVTGIGAGESKGHGGFLYDKILEPFLLHEIYEDKTRQEKVIQNSELDWTIVRPAILTNGKKTKKYKVVTDLKGFSASKVSRADVADFLVKQLSDRAYLKQAPVITRASDH